MGQTITERLDMLTREGRRALRDKDINALKEFKALEKEWERRALEGKAKKTQVEETKVVIPYGRNLVTIDGTYQTTKTHYESI